ncbi:UNVERIFIED_CONTAM: hypothetical protein GTU68_061383 [Idotea baltica]|nr:hypothetical protein [Idotea baltica]
MQIEQTPLPGVLILTPARFGDERGFFSESWNRKLLAEHGIDLDFVQDNHSMSVAVNTLRGLHFQAPPHAQDKLVRCGQGALFDVAVDIRKGSPTYGQWFGTDLTAENGRQLLVPRGFLHGFATRAERTEIYKARFLRTRIRWRGTLGQLRGRLGAERGADPVRQGRRCGGAGGF